MQFDRKITISAAGSRKSTVWPNQTIYWSEMVDRLKVAVRGTETLEAYFKMAKRDQDELKDVGGFVGGSLKDQRRKASNVTGRDLVTLDLDNIPDRGTQDVLQRIEGLGCAYAVYSTRKHIESKPRLRVIAPLSRTVSADEYEPIARKLSSIIGITLADPTTFEASRLMYWPSCSADSDYVFAYGDKPFLDADGLLTMYQNWQDINEWPQVPGSENVHVRLAAKQGNPLEKNGVIGAFCRTYNIYQAIETFLPGIYSTTADATRLTYLGGSTVGGAIVYQDGLFLYSHHATDPCSGRLVNAFDFVRLHKFSDLDNEAKADTPVNKLPSFVEMSAFALNQGGVADIINRERYEQALQDFDIQTDSNDLTSSETDDMNWISRLEISGQSGKPAKTIDNAVIVLENDASLKGKIAYDEFANRGMVLGPLPWNQNVEKRGWDDFDDAGIYRYMEKICQLSSAQKIDNALKIVSFNNSFNEVKAYLESLKWDGVPRLDTLFIDYLGAEDNVYTRAAARKSCTAAVARVMDPGCKYDYMPILFGPQGLGKSTFIRYMGKDWFSDNLQTTEGKEASELIQGVWIVEMGELTGLSRSETNATKQFLSRVEDIFRQAYGKRTQKFPRKCVFFGTTNNWEFLRDKTGDRRYWPIVCGLQQSKKNIFNDLKPEVDQIYAEALTRYQMGEQLFLNGEAAELAKVSQDEHRETSVKEGMIMEFVNRPVPVNWDKKSLAERRMYWGGEFGKFETETVLRDKICAAEIWAECFNGDVKYMKQSDTREINETLQTLDGWTRKAVRCGPYGKQRGFIKITSL